MVVVAYQATVRIAVQGLAATAAVAPITNAAVAIGAICGISASIPVSIGLALSQTRERSVLGAPSAFYPQPPIVIIQRINTGDARRAICAQNQATRFIESREFKIVGEE